MAEAPSLEVVLNIHQVFAGFVEAPRGGVVRFVDLLEDGDKVFAERPRLARVPVKNVGRNVVAGARKDLRKASYSVGSSRSFPSNA